ncbi:Cubilin [Armadillidium vulgare]|nr:Cubilin [Armadillidium vulgare]
MSLHTSLSRFTGNGIGPSGCVPSTPGGGSYAPTQNPCTPSPCIHGICSAVAGQAHCSCNPGYTGLTCAVQINPCASSPCLNGGTCTSSSFSSFRCSCPSTHTGDRCQTLSNRCGGVITGSGGIVDYPGPNQDTYGHNISCAYRITVPRNQVISVNFTEFHLQKSRSCQFDWLQKLFLRNISGSWGIHDGPRSDSHLIGRFCGTRFPGVNGSIIICGGTIRDQEHGAINSPGYPGRYPKNRDCYWTIEVTPGNKIQFVFATLQIEHHPNCSWDFLAVYDGLTDSDHLLTKVCSTQRPPPQISSGSEAMIHFHSDNIFTDTGFHIAFVSIPGNNMDIP